MFKLGIFHHYGENISLDHPLISNHCKDVQIILLFLFYVEMDTLRSKSRATNLDIQHVL
jgi:hypothetical protein